MNAFAYLILALMLLVEIFEIIIALMNVKHSRGVKDHPSEEVLRLINKTTLDKAISYLSAKAKPMLIARLVNIPVFFGLFLSGYLVLYSNLINELTENEVLRAIVLMSSFFLLFRIINLPIQIYSTFVVEKNFGFSRYTPGLYVADRIKKLIMSLIMISISMGVVVTVVELAGTLWWLYAAGSGILLILLMQYLYPAFISPMFNKYEKLEDGRLREKIGNIAEKAKFSLDNILKMDASRRSTHANASFSGIGKRKRIILYDTFLDNNTDESIVAILAHEIGHYKLNHVKKRVFLMFVAIFLAFFVMGLLINENFIYESFGFEKSTYIGIFLMVVLFSPTKAITKPLASLFSRRQEYEADRFAVEILNNKEDLAQALINLNKDNLANPHPHPVYSRWHNTHPTLLERIAAIKAL